MSMLWLLCNNPLAAQHKMVKLSNFDPAFYRLNGNSHVPYHPWAYSNIWGDEINGREYAFIGVSGWDYQTPNHGISVVDVTDPLNIYEVAFIEAPSGDQRDFVTYTDPASGSTYLYSVCEGNGKGLLIVDITNLPSGFTILDDEYYIGNYDEACCKDAHNIQLDEANGLLLICGIHHDTNPVTPYVMVMLDIQAHPMFPSERQVFDFCSDGTYYVHDVYFNNNKLYTASIGPNPVGPAPPGTLVNFYEPTISSGQFDVTGSIDPYPVNQSPLFSVDDLNHVVHDVYVNETHTLMVTSDEHILGQAIFWDISNPASITEVGRYNGHRTVFADTVAQHNHVLKGDRCYTAHYSNGLWVLDVSDPGNVQEIAYYDTYLQHNYGNYSTYLDKFYYQALPDFNRYSTGYFGAWGVFADLPSGNILVSDMNNGLYVLNNCVPEDNQSGANLTLTTASYSNVVYGRAAQTAITVNPGSGNFTVGTDANVTLIAGSKISLKPGFHAQSDGKFHAQIAFMCQNCDECPENLPGISKPGPANPQQPAATADKMECYPNPTANQLHLKMNIAAAGYSSLSVYDQFGRNVLTILENSYTDTGVMEKILDVSALPAGIYTLKLKSASGIQTSRFTKI